MALQAVMVAFIVTLFWASVTCNSPPYPIIYSYNENGTFLGEVASGSINPDCKWYIIGNGTTQVVLWNPYDIAIGGGLKGGVWAQASQQFVNDTKVNGEEIYSVQIYNSDWGPVVSDPICGPGEPCPDLMIIGTTQIASRVANGDVLSLQDYFAQYTYETGDVLSDDFLKMYFYEYYIGEVWYAVPLVSDLRLLYWNRTTFDRLGLTYPPPFGDWGTPYYEGWTWEVFTDYARIITEDTGIPGFFFNCGYDEELFLTMMIAHNWAQQLLYENYTCGVQNSRFYTAMEATLLTWIRDGSLNPAFAVDPNSTAFEAWLHEGDVNPIDEPYFCCMDGNYPYDPRFVGMATDTPTHIGYILEAGQAIYDSRENQSARIGIGYPPGKNGFLGGSGILITKNGHNHDAAWQLASYFFNTDLPYLDAVAEDSFAPPPFDSELSIEPWTGVQWDIVTDTLDRGIPPEYPLTTFPQYGTLENAAPFRMFFLNLMYKNMSLDEATARVCDVINYIFLPNCDSSYYEYVIGGCSPSTNQQTLSYKWSSSVSRCKMSSGSILPNPIYLQCPQIGFESLSGLGFVIATSLLLVFMTAVMAIFWYNRLTAVMKRWSIALSEIVIFGTIIIYISVYFNIGPPTVTKCTARIWFLSFGFTLFIGSFAAKMYRIQKIFIQAGFQRVTITTQHMMEMVGVLALIDLCLLVLWTFVKNDAVDVTYTSVENFGTVSQNVCSWGYDVILVVIMLYKCVLLLYGLYTCWKTRHVPEDFSENKFILAAMFAIFFCIFVLVPLMVSLQDQAQRIVFLNSGILFAVTCANLVFVVPKLYALFKKDSADGSPVHFWAPTSGTILSQPSQLTSENSGIDLTDSRSRGSVNLDN